MDLSAPAPLALQLRCPSAAAAPLNPSFRLIRIDPRDRYEMHDATSGPRAPPSPVKDAPGPAPGRLLNHGGGMTMAERTSKPARRNRPHRARLALAAVCASLAAPGCSREFFRNWADQDVTEAVYEKSRDPRWRPDLFTIEPPALSRYASPYDPDRPPAPPDDYAAEALSPVPQWPVHRLITPAEGTGYLDLLEKWRRERPAGRPVDRGVDSGPTAQPGAGPDPETEIEPFVPPPNSGTDPDPLSPIPPTGDGEAAPPDPRDSVPAAPDTPAPPDPREPVPSQPPTAQRALDRHVLSAAYQVPDNPAGMPDPLPADVVAGEPDVVGGMGGEPADAAGRDLIKILKPEAVPFDEGLAAGLPPEIDPYVVDPRQALTLALQNSRAYQFQLEQLYITSLTTTAARFRFEPQFQVGSGTTTTPIGGGVSPNQGFNYQYRTAEAPGGQLSLLNFGTVAGVGKLLSFGTRIAGGIANQTIINFGGPNNTITTQSSGFLPLSVSQMFLQGGGRAVTLENLTQAERSLLYQVRTFAQFRREFVVSILAGQGVTGGGGDPAIGYLNVLQQLQAVENNTKNVAAFGRVYEVFQQLGVGAGSTVAPLDIVTVEQQLQNQRLQLVTSLNGYRNTLDNYKVQLGLPPDVTLVPDSALLQGFRTVFDEIDALTSKPRATLNRMVADLPVLQDVFIDGRPVIESFRLAYETGASRQPIEARIDERQRLAGLLDRLTIQIRRAQTALPGSPDPERAARDLADFEEQFRLNTEDLARIDSTDEADRAEVRRLIDLQEQYLIQAERKLEDVNRAAERIALENRVDLMNARAQLYDAWRQLAVTANALQGVFNVNLNNQVLTSNSSNNPFAFDSSAKNFSLSLNAELPLIRLNERNTYVQAHIQYERQRRTLMQAEDQIKLQVRTAVRNLQLIYNQYEINKQSYIAALVTQDQAFQRFLEPPSGAGGSAQGGTLVLNLNSSLANVLGAQNRLVAGWVSYQTQRLAFYRDLGTMPYDEWEAFYELFPSASGTDSDPAGTVADIERAAVAAAASAEGLGRP